MDKNDKDIKKTLEDYDPGWTNEPEPQDYHDLWRREFQRESLARFEKGKSKFFVYHDTTDIHTVPYDRGEDVFSDDILDEMLSELENDEAYFPEQETIDVTELNTTGKNELIQREVDDEQ